MIFLIFIHSVLSFLPDCKSQKNCTSCYAHSSACHWCPYKPSTFVHNIDPIQNGSCHVRGSVYGCSVGAPCENNSTCQLYTNCDDCAEHSGCKWCGTTGVCDGSWNNWNCFFSTKCFDDKQCRRPSPEFVGYSTQIPKSVQYGLLYGFLFYLFILVSFWGCCFFSKKFFLNFYSVDTIFSPSVDSVTEVSRDNIAIANYRVEMTSRSRLKIKHLFNFLFKISTCLCAFSLIFIICCIFVIITYFPANAHVSICNSKLSWTKSITSAIIHQLDKTSNVNVETETLLSIYNPNRIDIFIEKIHIDFYIPKGDDDTSLYNDIYQTSRFLKENNVRISENIHNPLNHLNTSLNANEGTRIGQAIFGRAQIPSGSVSDHIAVVDITNLHLLPWMYLQLKKNALLIDADIDITFSMGDPSSPSATLTFWKFNAKIEHVHLNASSHSNQQYCLCHT